MQRVVEIRVRVIVLGLGGGHVAELGLQGVLGMDRWRPRAVGGLLREQPLRAPIEQRGKFLHERRVLSLLCVGSCAELVGTTGAAAVLQPAKHIDTFGEAIQVDVHQAISGLARNPLRTELGLRQPKRERVAHIRYKPWRIT